MNHAPRLQDVPLPLDNAKPVGVVLLELLTLEIAIEPRRKRHPEIVGVRINLPPEECVHHLPAIRQRWRDAPTLWPTCNKFAYTTHESPPRRTYRHIQDIAHRKGLLVELTPGTRDPVLRVQPVHVTLLQSLDPLPELRVIAHAVRVIHRPWQARVRV